ncbi:unnamed protein product [Ceratitis capitata]|uniref:(Mediterranean fruit fly) hypothetical protein n=1 Tax=Ceratitis capitata TaxID=7213 RepID=A0A811U1S8_CERCA|nr:unnamed protein product [Ceratitis capitata]
MDKILYNAILLLIVLAIATALLKPGDGKPTCTTKAEIDIGLFRNNWDPTLYWKCEVIDELPTLERCPDQMAYLDSIKDCVSWEYWQWEEPIEPLTIAEQS